MQLASPVVAEWAVEDGRLVGAEVGIVRVQAMWNGSP